MFFLIINCETRMNKMIPFFTLLFIISCSKSEDEKPNNEIEQEIPISETWEIATWKNFNESAISHTWDDTTAKQLSIAMPIYDEFDFKMTFFVADVWTPDWTGLKKASNNGHEIAAHTLTHTSFNEQTIEEIEEELADSKEVINTQMGNTNCIAFAYPFCNSENYNLTEDYYIAARGCSGQIVSNTPTDFMNISSFVCGTEGANQTASDFNTIANNAANQNGWGVYLFHGIDNDGGWSPIESGELKEHLEYLDVNKDKFWVDTFVNVVKYIKEREEAIISEVDMNETIISAMLTDALNDEIYNYPLTIRKEVPLSWSNISVKQNGNVINFTTETVASKKYITLNAVPDAGEIQIIKI